MQFRRKIVRRAVRDRVRTLSLFRSMDESRFHDLYAAAELRRIPRQHVLAREGNLPDALYVLVDGAIETFSTHDGHETTIDILRPVTVFGLAAVVRDDVHLSSARSLASVRVLSIPAPTVRTLLDRDPGFARAAAGELAERYRAAVRSLKNEKLRTGAERLANWVLRAGSVQGNRRAIELAFEKRTLASSLGMTPESLSRNLARLARYGVRSSGRGLVIEDRSALERFAKPNALIDG